MPRSSFLFVLFALGCSSATNRVEAGMTMYQVRKLLGHPKRRTFRGDHKTYYYETKKQRTKEQYQLFVVRFYKGKVVALEGSESRIDEIRGKMACPRPRVPKARKLRVNVVTTHTTHERSLP